MKAINYDKRSLGPLLALAAVMLLASVLRFYGLEIQSLRFDELETWRYAIKSPPGILEATRVNGSDPHPPGYYLFIHYWMQLGRRGVGAQAPLGCGRSALSVRDLPARTQAVL